MHRFPAMLATIVLFVATPASAAGSQPWPWKAKAPRDPALATLSHIEGVTASVAEGTVSIAVKAMAPAPGYTELQLVSRMGDPADRIFAFDACGRSPQEVTSQVLTPVTILKVGLVPRSDHPERRPAPKAPSSPPPEIARKAAGGSRPPGPVT